MSQPSSPERPTNPHLARLFDAAKRLAVAKHRKEVLAKAATGLRAITEAMREERRQAASTTAVTPVALGTPARR